MFNEVKEITLEESKKYIFNQGAKDWHVFRVKDWYTNPIEMIELSKKINEARDFRIKEQISYGKKYSGISLQYSKMDDNYEFGSVSPLQGHPPSFVTKHGTRVEKIDNNKYRVDNEIHDLKSLLALGIPIQESPDPGLYLFLNEWAKDFKPLITKWNENEIVLERGRLLKADIGQNKKVVHVDNDIRLHVPISTNKDVYFCFYDNDGKNIEATYHLKDEGCGYIFNSWVYHSFVNEGDQPRLHLIFTLWSQYQDRFLKYGYSSIDDILKDVSISL